MQPHPHAVGRGRSAVHAKRDVADVGLFHVDRGQHAEEGEREGDVGEEVEVEARPANGADDLLDLIFRIALVAQFLNERQETLLDRIVEIFIEIDALGDHDHDGMAVAEILDIALPVSRNLKASSASPSSDCMKLLWTTGK